MGALRSRVSAIAVAAIAVLCLTGSSRAFITKVEGSQADAVSFHFYRSASDAEPTKFRIIEFVVQEQKSETEWTTAWELKGEQRLNTITYGTKYEGLAETESAKPLSPNVKYRALVSEKAWLRPRGYSAVYFVIGEGGAVAVVGPK